MNPSEAWMQLAVQEGTRESLAELFSRLSPFLYQGAGAEQADAAQRHAEVDAIQKALTLEREGIALLLAGGDEESLSWDRAVWLCLVPAAGCLLPHLKENPEATLTYARILTALIAANAEEGAVIDELVEIWLTAEGPLVLVYALEPIAWAYGFVLIAEGVFSE